MMVMGSGRRTTFSSQRHCQIGAGKPPLHDGQWVLDSAQKIALLYLATQSDPLCRKTYPNPISYDTLLVDSGQDTSWPREKFVKVADGGGYCCGSIGGGIGVAIWDWYGEGGYGGGYGEKGGG